MHFQNQQQVDYLNQQNEKLINKLMHIAKRRSNSFFKVEEPSMVHYRAVHWPLLLRLHRVYSS
jgi:hypothetical protein